MSVLCEYVTVAYCRIFRQSARITYFFTHKVAFSTKILTLPVFLLPISLVAFVTSTIWLPTDWHHPCVWTPVERDGGSWFQAILYHVSAYFHCIFGIYEIRIFLIKMLHETDMPNWSIKHKAHAHSHSDHFSTTPRHGPIHLCNITISACFLIAFTSRRQQCTHSPHTPGQLLLFFQHFHYPLNYEYDTNKYGVHFKDLQKLNKFQKNNN